LVQKILNRLHRDTRQWAIRDNLFIREKTPLFSYLLADNERYLRSLDYIQDARIVVKPIAGSQDSVDIYVITKDFFSLNGQLNNASPGKFKARVGDVNLLGAAQNLQGTILVQKDRSPGVRNRANVHKI
jgi:outer membrane protein assembly factor BamA